MIHGRHRGVSLNFQAKIPTAKSPNTIPTIFGTSIIFILRFTPAGAWGLVERVQIQVFAFQDFINAYRYADKVYTIFAKRLTLYNF